MEVILCLQQRNGSAEGQVSLQHPGQQLISQGRNLCLTLACCLSHKEQKGKLKLTAAQG